MIHKDNILELRSQGLSYRQIEKQLGCSKSNIAYHCGKGQKDKAEFRRQKQKNRNRLRC